MTPDLLAYLAETLTAERLDKIEAVLALRTRQVAVVLEDIYHSPNAGAVIRTCECLGVQDIYAIRRNKPFCVNTDVVRGSSQWTTLRRYEGVDSTGECIAELRRRGYRLAAATLRPGRTLLTPADLPVDAPLAICLGEEEFGLSDRIHEAADYWVRIPMYGFTQSFNISVSAAMLLQATMERLRAGCRDWRLSEMEKEELRTEWICNSVKHLDLLIARFEQDHPAV